MHHMEIKAPCSWQPDVTIECFTAQKHPLTTRYNHHAGAQAIIKELGHQQRWLGTGYDLEIGHL